MRYVYLLLVYLVMPFVVLHDAWQALTSPEHRGRLKSRLGFVRRSSAPGALWIHAVSVGEVQAAAAVVQEIRRRHPALPVVVSTVTATGSQRAQALFKTAVEHCYLPYDLPGAVNRFLDRVAPGAALILETEIWPTLYLALHRRRIPLVLGSARLSERSVRRFKRMPALLRDVLSADSLIGAQTATDAERFTQIGATPGRVHVTGNVKYDLEIAPAVVAAGEALRARWGRERPVWIAGSTHEGEEEACLQAHAAIRQQHPTALLVLVPRHPPRFGKVRELLRERGVRFAQRSLGEAPGATDEVLLIDTLGELQMFYATADAAFVGGSLVLIGGHSLLEPAVLGLPVLSGPHTHNSQDVADLLVRHDALTIVHSADELAQRVRAAFDQPAAAKAAGSRGAAAVAANRGAVQRLVAMLEPLLKSTGVSRATSSAGSGTH